MSQHKGFLNAAAMILNGPAIKGEVLMRSSEKHILVNCLLEDTIAFNNAYFDVEWLLKREVLKQVFSLHQLSADGEISGFLTEDIHLSLTSRVIVLKENTYKNLPIKIRSRIYKGTKYSV